MPCYEGVPCNLTANATGGFNITFEWSSLEFGNVSTVNKSIDPIFTSQGTFQVDLAAYDSNNPNSPLFASANVTVVPGTQNLSLVILNTDSINPNRSDVSTRNLSILFTTGPIASYICELLIDLEATILFNQTSQPNNSIINYYANRTGLYAINLTCSFGDGSVNRSVSLNHYVEDPIRELSLVNTTVILANNTQLVSLLVSMANGTDPIVIFYLNGIKDMGFVFNSVLFLGYSSQYSGIPGGANNVTISAYNNVSYVSVDVALVVKYKIFNPVIQCDPAVSVINGLGYYMTETAINCYLNMTTGSKVSVAIFISSIPIFSYNFTGEWTTVATIPYNFSQPGKIFAYFNFSIIL